MATVTKITDGYYKATGPSLEDAAMAGLLQMQKDEPQVSAVSVSKIRLSAKEGQLSWEVTITP